MNDVSVPKIALRERSFTHVALVVSNSIEQATPTLHTCAQALRPLMLAQTHARTSAVLVDEFDTSVFQREPYFLTGFASATQKTILCLQPLYSGNGNIGRGCQLLLGPVQ
jgi:hypothetical protein